MSKPQCPSCQTPLAPEDINVARDTAYCRQCGNAFSLAKLVHDDAETTEADDDEYFPSDNPFVVPRKVGFGPFVLERPPHGVTYEPSNFETKLTATCRSWGTAIGLGVFSLGWNSIVSVFVVGGISQAAGELGFALPAWFPNLGNIPINEHPSTAFSLWLILVPFILVGIGISLSALNALFGKITITLKPSAEIGRVFTGISPLGWWKNFNPTSVREIIIGETMWRKNYKTQPQLHIIEKTGRVIKFGSMLSSERLNYLCFALRKLCLKKPPPRRQ